MSDDNIDNMTHIFSLRKAASSIIRVISASRAKNSDRKLDHKLDLNSVTAGALVRLVQSVFIPACVEETDLSWEKRRRVRAHQECVLRAVKQHVVSLLASRADPPADRSRRSIWHDQGDDQGGKKTISRLRVVRFVLSFRSRL